MRWRPAHEAHAIEVSSLTFQFMEPVPAKPWQSLLEAVSSTASGSGFNHIQDQFDLQVSMGGMPGFPVAGQVAPNPLAAPDTASNVPLSNMASFPSGRLLLVVDSGGMREQMLLRRDSLTYASSRYVGWSAFKRRIGDLLSSTLSASLHLVDLSAVKLEYWDRFVFQGAAAEARYDELLRSGSPYLPGFPAQTSELWHSHVGLFVPSGTIAKRLLNLNVDVMDAPDSAGPGQQPVSRRTVMIYSMTQDSLSAGASPQDYSGVTIFSDGLHATLKDMFAGVITDEMARCIALKPQEPV